MQIPTKNYIVWAKYKELLLDKYLLPIFVSFHPDNKIKLKLNNIREDKLQDLINITKTWFKELHVLTVEEIKESSDD